MSEAPGLPERQLRLSWSRLRTWTECSEKAYLQSQGRRSPVSDIRGYFRGTVADRCMRHYLTAAGQEQGAMAAMVDRVLDSAETEARETGDGIVRWKHPADKAEVRSWCKVCVTRLEPLLATHVLPHEFDVAFRFSAPLTIPYLDGTEQRVFLVGEMDLLVRDALQRYAIWDLKATEDGEYWRKVTGQLIFYDICVYLLFGSWPQFTGLLQPMCDQPVLSFVFSSEDRRKMLTDIVRYCESVWAGKHSPKASTSGCDRCEVRHACPRYATPAGRGRVPWPSR